MVDTIGVAYVTGTARVIETRPVVALVEGPLCSGSPADSGPLGATPMRCCGTWEEDENAVDWSSGRAGNGFVHYPGKRCR